MVSLSGFYMVAGFGVKTWEFPKIRGTLFWGPSNKDPTISGTILGPPIIGNSHMGPNSRGFGGRSLLGYP